MNASHIDMNARHVDKYSVLVYSTGTVEILDDVKYTLLRERSKVFEKMSNIISLQILK